MSDSQTPINTDDENKLVAERRAKLAAIREQGNAFPNEFRPQNQAQDLQESHGDKTKEALEEAAEVVSVAGRIIRNRGAFMELQDGSGRIQLYVTKEARPDRKSVV